MFPKVLDWTDNLIGETATIAILVALLLLSIAAEIWEWIAWIRLRREHPASRLRRSFELTSPMAGTASIVLFALFLTGIAQWIAGGTDWALDLWIFAGMGVCWLALVASPFCRGRVRIAGLIVGVLMAWFWWGVWDAVQFARGFAG